MRILVVEDSEKMATLIRRGLQEQGFAVDAAGDAEEAAWFAGENPYDAIVLDIALDVLASVDGFEVCRSAPRDGRLMDTRVDAHRPRRRG